MFRDVGWKIIEDILNEIQIGLTFIDPDGNLLYYNRLASELIGWDKKDKNSVLNCHPPAKYGEVLNKIVNNHGREWHRLIKIGGKVVENTYSPISIPDRFTGIVVITRDVTEREKMAQAIKKAAEDLHRNNAAREREINERKLVEKYLRESEERFRTLVDSMDDIVFTLDTDQRHTGLFGRWVEKNGLTPQFFLGRTARDIFSNNFQVHEESNSRAVKGENVVYEWSAESQNGPRHFQTSLSPIFGSDGKVTGVVGVGRDITDRKQAEEMIQRLSYLDGLTGIPNRRRFDEILLKEWRRLMRSGKPLSIVMCDNDYFKLYNDTYGHQKGDQCLKEVASTLKTSLKRPDDLVARYGGEEFVVILPETDCAGAVKLAETLRSSIENLKLTHEKSSVSHFVTISLGVSTTIPDPGDSPDRLISKADQALYQAKKEGRNRVMVFCEK